MKLFITSLFAICCLANAVWAQKQVFDIVTYSPPKGWKKDGSAQAVQFSKQDEAGKTYCLITLFKSLDTRGGPADNFSASWETLVKDNLNVQAAPQMMPVSSENGWEAHTGTGVFESEGNKGIALLTTSTGYSKTVNILVLTNSDAYENELDQFFSSISFPKLSDTKVTPTTPKTMVNNGSATARKDGFTYTTTNFDNGWTSTAGDEYVQVLKGDIKVYLFFTEKFNPNDGSGNEPRQYYWEHTVSKYFTTGQKVVKGGGALSDYSPNYIEGWATDKQTGAKRYIGMIMRIVPYTGTMSLIIVSAAGPQQLRQQFPKADQQYDNDLLPMYGYNKFAIGKNDLPGTWLTGGKGGTMDWYSTSSGDHVGSTGAVTSDVFNFASGNTYTSEHKGATGWVGAMNTYQQKYKGNYTVTDWSITVTNRWEGKTEKYDAWFEMAGRGRILHMVYKSSEMLLQKE